MTAFWARTALGFDGSASGGAIASVRITSDASGRIASVTAGVEQRPGDVVLDTVLPGFGNAHSHAFHRLLRGRTHDEGGDFWRWRERMYAAASRLDPERYRSVAAAVFGEMLACGWTAVGEFHYLHHRADGRPYLPAHAMELALAAAARETGIRLVLLDTAYLSGGFGRPLAPEQRAFGDGSAERYLERWYALRDALASDGAPTLAAPGSPGGLVTLGAALHSVRAVPFEAARTIVAGLPADVPLHVHVSEQPRENADALAATGATPTRLLADAGALAARTSLVHATHPEPGDLELIAASGATVVLCPSTEADLGDGVGPARRYADAGVPLAIGSDQNAVIDPLLELRGLEAGERLASGERGRFSPAALLRAGTVGGYRALGISGAGVAAGISAGVGAVGGPCDLVELDAASLRTLGSAPDQLLLTATAADVGTVVVGGRVVSTGDHHDATERMRELHDTLLPNGVLP